MTQEERKQELMRVLERIQYLQRATLEDLNMSIRIIHSLDAETHIAVKIQRSGSLTTYHYLFLGYSVEAMREELGHLTDTLREWNML